MSHKIPFVQMTFHVLHSFIPLKLRSLSRMKAVTDGVACTMGA
jgi:hypothetical protein